MKHEYLLFGLVFNKPTIEQVIKKLVLSQNFKSSRSDGFYKKGVLRNFPKFTGKHPCQFASEECIYSNLPEMIVMKSQKSRKSRGTVGPLI